MSLKLSTKFQPSVTLSSGEGRGEVLKAELIGSVLMGDHLPDSDLTPNPSPEERGTLDFNLCVNMTKCD